MALLLWGCSTQATPGASLYDRLGGLPIITAIVDRTIDRHVADPRTRRSFDGVDLKSLKASIVSQACEATGGPCKYQGKPMLKAHEGLDITPEEFDTAMGHMSQTLDELHIGPREKEEFLVILRPLKTDIVGH
jgi:hemoglobin